MDFTTGDAARQLSPRLLPKTTRPAVLTENVVVVRFGPGGASSPTPDNVHLDPIIIGERLYS
jgi:hypothetical protein